MHSGVIYVLIDPRNQEIRYVGQTSDPELRTKAHVVHSQTKKSHRAHWINKLRRLGYSPVFRVVQDLPVEHLTHAEVYWISYFRSLGCDLTNQSDGGEGTIGYRHSAETRAKMSKKRKSRNFKTGPRSEETKERIRQAALRQFQSPEARKSVGRKGRSIPIQTRLAVSQSTKRRWETHRLRNAARIEPETRTIQLT